ncbi:uncharacterized protein N0V89_009110 [Didymosphaeria variabile]|uniref:Uncharacterized protein n=1 Tax=Didymosphaeria variabile TaxID=1932322 RepID=A0A9W8XJ01_9PLEO|nr:uncharacterized protein N0V89_009110 [Didymosphaeria variabile]KAJ4350489.1 hypothetical protein N0V89_009110 [Didymosphaeria variabile]
MSQALLGRLQDPSDALADHIREVQLGPFADEGYFLTEALRYDAGDGTTVPYSTWLKILQRILYVQEDKGTEVIPLGLAPRSLSYIQHLVQDPESITSENDLSAIVMHDEGYISPLLERALKNLANLRSLTWRSHLPFPRDALRALKQMLPSAKINIVFPWELRSMPIDRTLLASPQIYSVDIYVHRSSPFIPQDAYSEYRTLKDCLVRGNSVKRLSIHEYKNFDVPRQFRSQEAPQNGGSALINWTRVTRGPLNFDWQDGDHFPSLESLKLPEDEYHLPAKHCDMWTRCMDWSHLLRLDVSESAPQHLLKVLTGRVPQLEHLRFGQWLPICNDASWKWGKRLDIKRFLNSITALKELTFCCWDCSDYLSLFQAQRLSLRRVKIENNKSFDSKEERELALRLLETFPRLTDAEFKIQSPALKGSWALTQALTPQQKLKSMLKGRPTLPPPLPWSGRGIPWVRTVKLVLTFLVWILRAMLTQMITFRTTHWRDQYERVYYPSEDGIDLRGM